MAVLHRFYCTYNRVSTSSAGNMHSAGFDDLVWCLVLYESWLDRQIHPLILPFTGLSNKYQRNQTVFGASRHNQCHITTSWFCKVDLILGKSSFLTLV